MVMVFSNFCAGRDITDFDGVCSGLKNLIGRPDRILKEPKADFGVLEFFKMFTVP